MRPDLFVLGYVEYALPEADAGPTFERIRRQGISVKAVKRDEKTGEIHFRCTRCAAREAAALSPRLREVERGGLPVLLARARYRPGMLAGVVLSLLLLILSGLFVWDVRVEGNEQIPADELERELAEVGLFAGRFLPTLNGDAVSLSLRQRDGRLAFVSVNVRGTVANVQVRETVSVTEAPRLRPANLVAGQDGVVTLPLIFEGEVLVKAGDVVRAGQMLAGGVIDSEKHGYRVTRAAGQVLARTVHTYRVTVPLAYEEKVYTGEVGREVSLSFFGFQGKVFKTTGNSYIDCDIIENIKWCTLPDGTRLPLGVTVKESAAYEWRPATRTVTEARALALAELERQLAADSAGRTLLSRTVEVQANGDGVTLVCTLICEEDIAVTVEFERTTNPS